MLTKFGEMPGKADKPEEDEWSPVYLSRSNAKTACAVLHYFTIIHRDARSSSFLRHHILLKSFL